LIRAVKRAQSAGLSVVRDGATAREVYGRTRRVISGEGYLRYYLHGAGHGVGMDIHEPPSLAPTSNEVLKKGMVITVEPGIYVPNVGGARWEDTVEVTGSGYVQLTVLK